MIQSSPTVNGTSWNGLTLYPPQDWETIISGNRHLIFEHDLQPIIELRWEPGQDRLSIDKQRERFIRRLQSESQHSVHFSATGSSLPVNRECFDARLFGSDANAPNDGALMICTHCRSLILVKFHTAWNSTNHSGRDFLEKLVCQHQNGGPSVWAIQDVSFNLPGEFSLQRYNIRFGMSSFSFASSTTNLDLCRLAPASEHLKKSGLGQLFELFSKTACEHQDLLDEYTLYSAKHPGFIEGLLARLRRRRPFTAAHFQHLPEHDRILGFRLESARPLPAEMIQTIRDGYGLVQKEA